MEREDTWCETVTWVSLDIASVFFANGCAAFSRFMCGGGARYRGRGLGEGLGAR
jgi:hypothetical protein